MSELRNAYDPVARALRVSGTGGAGGAPSGAAGGDLSGTYPDPTVAKLNGVAAANYTVASLTTFSNANYTVLSTDRTVMQIGTLSAPRTATLPAASALPAGATIVIGDASGTVTTTNTITITRAGSDTINGATTAVIGSPYGSRALRSDGTSKWSFDGGVLRASQNLSDVQSATTSRTNLGLGTLATQADSAVAITGGTVTGITDVAVADGGTGASTAQNARNNLGVSSWGNAQVLTVETTTSATFTDLTTAGPSVTITVPASGVVLVWQSSFLKNDTASDGAKVGLDISGASTVSASTNETNFGGLSLTNNANSAGLSVECSKMFVVTGLTAGSTTFKMQYRRTVGGTATFADRVIVVQTLP